MSDHKAEALRLAEIADSTFGRIEHRNGADAVSQGVEALIIATEAQVHATLALVEQQRIANLLAFVASVQRGSTDTLPSDTVMRRAESAGAQVVEGLGLS